NTNRVSMYNSRSATAKRAASLARIQSGRGLPHSKTLREALKRTKFRVQRLAETLALPVWDLGHWGFLGHWDLDIGHSSGRGCPRVSGAKGRASRPMRKTEQRLRPA